MSIVSVKNLCKSYGKITALDNLCLSINQGEIYGLLGPNGAGKSTLIGILSGLIHVDRGEVRIFGEKPGRGRRKIKSRVGVVPQNLAIYEDLTARENISFFAGLYGLGGEKAADAVDWALEFTGLSERANSRCGGFSGGMKRRLNIACALAHRPDILIMDEPSVGIDPQSRNNILQSVRKLNESGMTVIYTTHYIEEVEAICTRTGIIDHGKLIAEGDTEQLKSLVADCEKIRIEVQNPDNVDLRRLNLVHGIRKAILDESSLHVECERNKNCWTPVISQLTENGSGILSVHSSSPNLEEVFLTLTGRSLRDQA